MILLPILLRLSAFCSHKIFQFRIVSVLKYLRLLESARISPLTMLLELNIWIRCHGPWFRQLTICPFSVGYSRNASPLLNASLFNSCHNLSCDNQRFISSRRLHYHHPRKHWCSCTALSHQSRSWYLDSTFEIYARTVGNTILAIFLSNSSLDLMENMTSHSHLMATSPSEVAPLSVWGRFSPTSKYLCFSAHFWDSLNFPLTPTIKFLSPLESISPQQMESKLRFLR